MLLADRVALITGGARGIGQGIALRFADEGCAVAVADIRMKEAEETIAEVKRRGGKGLAIQCDVTSASQIKDTVHKVFDTFGKIDILVNNAGGLISAVPPIEDMTEEEWDKTMALNLKSDFLFCKYVVPYMKQKKYGKIINFSSIGGIQPPHHAIAYNTAKAGVIGFTLDLATALAAHNVNVNVILPGPVKTTFYERRTGTMTEAEKEAFFDGLGAAVPMKRAATAEEMAGAALFLASDLSSYVTAETLLVAGGLPMIPQQ
jgi:NAD(P)-dependent dehydrogenase (short-subunit alcohol dehydrogenase family)